MEFDESMRLAMADTDFGVADHLDKEYHPKPYEIICYHCQQAAEKAVKAVIKAYNIPGGIPKTHDLVFLLEQLRAYREISEGLFDMAEKLTIYGVAVRYPNELHIDDSHVKNALKSSGSIVKWAKEVVALK